MQILNYKCLRNFEFKLLFNVEFLKGYEIRIGMIFPAINEDLQNDVGFTRSAGAVSMAIERLQDEDVLPGAEFK